MPGLDPFYVGWRAFEHGGISAVESIEAPIIMHAVDQIDPELADKLALKYADQGLRADDLRFGMWPDASPVQQRSNGEPVGVHLNTFGIRQVRYGEATEPERAALEVITFEAEELVRDAINPEYGAGIFQFGKIPTMHRHIVARETRGDGLGNWLERRLIDVNTRREMRDRLASAATPERLAAIAANVGKTLSRYAV
jgi:hypothetical protein